MAAFQGYPTLPSDDSESEVEMEGQQPQQPDSMAVVMGQLQQLLTKQAELDRTLGNIFRKRIRTNLLPRHGRNL